MTGGSTVPARAFELAHATAWPSSTRSGNLLDANPFMLRLLGYERDEVVGRSMAEFVHPEDLERAIRVVCMVGRDTLDVPVTPAIYRIRRHDGG